MTIRITTDMINTLGGAYTAENVRRVRALLVAAGVADVELHPLEIIELQQQRDRERMARAQAERLLALGPMPPHTCTLGDDGHVNVNNNCPHGCQRNFARRETA